MSDWWHYDNLPSGEPYDWGGAGRGEKPVDNLDFHLDLGCGVVPKGRLGIDRFYGPGVALAFDLENLTYIPVEHDQPEYDEIAKRGWELYAEHRQGETPLHGLPFPDNSIESIISHHCLEHIGDGFVRLMDECHRILKPGRVFRIIVPLFPSKTAVEDPDHKRYFMKESFETFCGAADGSHWHEGFSQPYTQARFQMVEKDWTGVEDVEKAAAAAQADDANEGVWGFHGARELRVTLRKWGEDE